MSSCTGPTVDLSCGARSCPDGTDPNWVKLDALCAPQVADWSDACRECMRDREWWAELRGDCEREDA